MCDILVCVQEQTHLNNSAGLENAVDEAIVEKTPFLMAALAETVNLES